MTFTGDPPDRLEPLRRQLLPAGIAAAPPWGTMNLANIRSAGNGLSCLSPTLGMRYDQRMGIDHEVHAFISYAGPEREAALRVRQELARRGVSVSMDDAFDPGTSVMVNVGLLLERPTVVIALISDAYLDRHFTEIEISAVMADPQGLFVPIMIGTQPSPRSRRGRGLWSVVRGRSLFRLDFTDDSFDRLVTTIKSKRHLAASNQPHESSTAITNVSGPVTVAYDWEDAHLLDAVESSLMALGVGAVTMGTATAVDPFSPTHTHIGVLWSRAAMSSREISRIALDSVVGGTPLTYLTTGDAPPTPGSAPIMRLDLQAAASVRDDATRPLPAGGWLEQLRSGMDRALVLNGGIPFHLLGDKYCASRATNRATSENYRLAVTEFAAGADIRIQSVLDHAACRRFRGDWDQARELLLREPLRENGQTSPLVLAAEADLISLEFELGHVAGIIGRASALLARCLSQGDWPTIIVMHRQLGMIHEEQGSYTSAREHLSLAFHYARDLLDTAVLEDRIQSRDARVALTADCLRELAALEWRAGESHLARSQLQEAGYFCDSISDHGLRKYLTGVVNYQQARVEYDIGRGYEKARDALARSYADLQEFDNPIRLATVLESIVRLEMDFLRESDERVGALRPTLEKVRRVREIRRHDYMIARTKEALGDLEYALGDWSVASEHYEAARREFNRLGKQPEAANSARALSRCCLRMEDSDRALAVLEGALDNLRDTDQRSVRSEIRSEMVRMLHQRLRPEEIDETTEMTGVGEFSVHGWIRTDLTASAAPSAPADEVVLGVGDDCAVLRLAADEDFAVTTDSTPPVMLDPGKPGTAAYAARFAVVSSLSDVLAMGARPTALLLNLHVRRDTPATWTRSLLQCADREARHWGAHIVGGDLKERDRPALTTMAIGRVRRGQVLTRHAARPGHHMVITLSGGMEHAFRGLGRRWAQALAPFLAEHEREAIRALVSGNAAYSDLGLPLETMSEVIDRRVARAAMDTSDGVLACAQLLGEASDVGVELDLRALDELVSDDVRALARMLGVLPCLFTLNAGHDWEVIFSSPPEVADRVAEIAHSREGLFPRLAVIGRFVRRASWSERGVRLLGRNDALPVLPFFTDEKFVTRPYEDRAKEWLEFAREASRALSSEPVERDPDRHPGDC